MNTINPVSKIADEHLLDMNYAKAMKQKLRKQQQRESTREDELRYFEELEHTVNKQHMVEMQESFIQDIKSFENIQNVVENPENILLRLGANIEENIEALVESLPNIFTTQMRQLVKQAIIDDKYDKLIEDIDSLFSGDTTESFHAIGSGFILLWYLRSILINPNLSDNSNEEQQQGLSSNKTKCLENLDKCVLNGYAKHSAYLSSYFNSISTNIAIAKNNLDFIDMSAELKSGLVDMTEFKQVNKVIMQYDEAKFSQLINQYINHQLLIISKVNTANLSKEDSTIYIGVQKVVKCVALIMSIGGLNRHYVLENLTRLNISLIKYSKGYYVEKVLSFIENRFITPQTIDLLMVQWGVRDIKDNNLRLRNKFLMYFIDFFAHLPKQIFSSDDKIKILKDSLRSRFEEYNQDSEIKKSTSNGIIARFEKQSIHKMRVSG